jgi:predicted small lipoprotein YifL
VRGGVARILLAGVLLWLAACGHVGPLRPPDDGNGGGNGSASSASGSGY